MVARRCLGESMLWGGGQQRTIAGLVGAIWGETFRCQMGGAVSLGGDSVKRAVEWPAVVPE